MSLSPFDIVDIIVEISSHLSYSERKNLCFVNKICSIAYIERRLANGTVFGVDLFMDKEIVLKDILTSSKRIVSIVAPPSYGKTLLQLLIVFTKYKYNIGDDVINDEERFLLVIPVTCVNTYLDELNKHWPNSFNRKNPGVSPVLLDSNCCKSHREYIDNGGYSVKNKLIIRTSALYQHRIVRRLRQAPTTSDGSHRRRRPAVE
jgi:hypothetical protein